MADKINLDELKEKGHNPFPAPEGYFKDFSQRMQQRIDEESETEKNNVVQFSSRWYYAAAAVVVLVMSVWLTNPFQADTSPIVTLLRRCRCYFGSTSRRKN